MKEIRPVLLSPLIARELVADELVVGDFEALTRSRRQP